MRHPVTSRICGCGLLAVTATALVFASQSQAGPLDPQSTAPPSTAPGSPAPAAAGAAAPAAATLTEGQLEALVAPIALYPDALLSQIFMASTYPLQVVEADRWVKANPSVTGDAAAKALEAQPWDPSVKSLVNFPQVLSMMSSKLDWTQNLGDAFIAQQKGVLDAVQSLRAKAKAEGSLKTTEQQVVKTEPATATAPQTIVIESSNPDVIYVPTYNPNIVYGAWAYPAYPPYYYYPPGYVATAAVSFGVGVACGLAWGYAWGNCDWNRGDVNVNVNRNTQFNQNINRQNYVNNYQNNINNSGNRRADFNGGQGTWQHDPGQRGGVPYGNGNVANRAGGGVSQQQAQQARDAFRGRADAGRQAINQGAASEFRGPNAPSGAVGDRGSGAAGGANRPGGDRGSGAAGGANRPGGDRGSGAAGGAGGANRPSGDRGSSGSGAFGGVNGGGKSAYDASNRGRQSQGSGFSQNRSSGGGGSYGQSRSGGSRSGYSGGGSRGGGGGARGGGGSRGGGGGGRR